MTITKPSFEFGYTAGLPANFDPTRDVAWGARFIMKPDGHCDYLADRAGWCGGEDEGARRVMAGALTSKVGTHGAIAEIKDGIRAMVEAGKLDYREAREAVVFRNGVYEAKANSNGSYGYCYVAFYEHGRRDVWSKPAWFCAKQFSKHLAWAYLFDNEGVIIAQRKLYFEEDGTLYTKLARIEFGLDNPMYAIYDTTPKYKPPFEEPAETWTAEKSRDDFGGFAVQFKRPDGSVARTVSSAVDGVYARDYKAVLKMVAFEHPRITIVEA